MSIADFADMLPHTVTVEPYSARDAYGKPSYGTAASVSARVMYRHRLVRDAAGDEVVARGEVWLARTTAVSTEDRITLPDGTQPIILAAELVPDDDGAHHVKVYFR